MKNCIKCLVEKDDCKFKKDKRLESGYTNICKTCATEINKKYPSDPIKEKARRKRYYDKNKDWRNELAAKYKKDNPEWHNKWRNDYQKRKRSEDVIFRLKGNLRSRVNIFIRQRGYKRGGMLDILGCDYHTVKEHLESLFKDDMSWDNYGKWEIDHIIPLCSSSIESELKALCHYKNLQPLWKEDNAVKGKIY